MSEPIWADALKNLDTPSSPEPLGLAGGSDPVLEKGSLPHLAIIQRPLLGEKTERITFVFPKICPLPLIPPKP